MVRPLVRILHHIHFGFFLAGNKTQHNFLTFTVGCGVIERKIVFCIDCCMFYLVSPTPPAIPGSISSLHYFPTYSSGATFPSSAGTFADMAFSF
jgi:hypothetical protein